MVYEHFVRVVQFFYKIIMETPIQIRIKRTANEKL